MDKRYAIALSHFLEMEPGRDAVEAVENQVHAIISIALQIFQFTSERVEVHCAIYLGNPISGSFGLAETDGVDVGIELAVKIGLIEIICVNSDQFTYTTADKLLDNMASKSTQASNQDFRL
jgi:hypothetical protein